MTDTPHLTRGIDPESLAEYRRWLNTLNGIGSVLADRIVKAYPDYFELASSSSSQIADRVKGLSEGAAKTILHAIAAETMKAGAPVVDVPSSEESEDDAVIRVSDVESEAGFAEPTTLDRSSEDGTPTEEENSVDFLSQPLEFKTVMEAKKHAPISIDALRQQHIAQQSAAGLRPDSDYQMHKGSGDFVAYRKPKKTDLPFSPEVAEAPPKKRRGLLLPFLLILIGLGLVGYSVFTLWQGDQPGNAGSTTKDPLVKFLTFDFLNKDKEEKEESVTPETETSSSTTDPDLTEVEEEPENPLPVDEEETPIAEPQPEPEPEPVVEPEPIVIQASEVSVSVLNGSGRTGAAGSGATVLRNAGYTITTTGNANNYAYDQTTVFYASNNLAKAEKVLADLSGTYEPKLNEGLYPGQTTDVVVVVGRR